VSWQGDYRPHPHPDLPLHWQAQLEKLVESNYYLNRSARDAYRSYVLAYASHSLKHIFNVNSLDLAAVGRSFGFSVPPRVNLSIALSGAGEKVARRGGGGGFGDPAKRRMSDYADPDKKRAALVKIRQSSGHSFSATNPYGKRAAGDARQFTR
jgi:ATP-dependent RNA helicase DDX18/HAS1